MKPKRPTQEIISIPWTFALIPATLTCIYEPVEDRRAAFQGRCRLGCLSTTFGSAVRRPVCESTRPFYLPSAHRADRRPSSRTSGPTKVAAVAEGVGRNGRRLVVAAGAPFLPRLRRGDAEVPPSVDFPQPKRCSLTTTAGGRRPVGHCSRSPQVLHGNLLHRSTRERFLAGQPL